jgi:diaminopimelate epimerase
MEFTRYHAFGNDYMVVEGQLWASSLTGGARAVLCRSLSRDCRMLMTVGSNSKSACGT